MIPGYFKMNKCAIVSAWFQLFNLTVQRLKVDGLRIGIVPKLKTGPCIKTEAGRYKDSKLNGLVE